VFAGESKPGAAINEERSETVENPVEAKEKADTGKNEETAHHQRAENSPKQHAVLVFFGHSEVAEDYKEDEKIVDAEREFEYVTRDELDGDLTALPEENQSGKGCRQAEPHGASSERLARAHHAAAAMEDTEIQHQHAEREKIEENPEIDQVRFPVVDCQFSFETTTWVALKIGN